MIEHYKSPLKLTCVACRGEGVSHETHGYGELEGFERICKVCDGLGYTTDFVDMDSLGGKY